MADRTAAPKFALLRQIYDLAREQREALEQDSLERFQHLLDEREELIGRVRVMDTEDVALSELPRNVVAFPRPSGAAAEDALALDALIRGILERDHDNEMMLAEKMDEIRRTLPDLAAGSRAAAGYRLGRDPSAFIDRTS